MTIKSSPYYWVECDEKGCDSRSPSEYDDYSAMGSKQDAIYYAEDCEWSFNSVGKARCPDHMPFEVEEEG